MLPVLGLGYYVNSFEDDTVAIRGYRAWAALNVAGKIVFVLVWTYKNHLRIRSQAITR